MDAPTYDCLECGACCRHAHDGQVLVSAEDVVRWKREGRDDIVSTLVPGHFSQDGFPCTPEGHCVYLGSPGKPHHCTIYETRGECCHALVPGSSQCLSYRRSGGVDPPLPR